MNLTTVRQALSTTLDTISGLTCYWYVPDKPSVPFVLVKPESCDLRDVLGSSGQSTATYTLIVCVNGNVDLASQIELDKYLSTEGTSSIPLTLYNSPTLAQSGLSAVATSWQSYGRVTLEDNTAWTGAEITVEVMSA